MNYNTFVNVNQYRQYVYLWHENIIATVYSTTTCIACTYLDSLGERDSDISSRGNILSSL